MKGDLVTAILTAIFGVVISFVVTNVLFGSIAPVSIKTVDDNFGVDIVEPNEEVFNYRSINPTVEVYIGNNDNCANQDSEGNCVYVNNQPSSDSSNSGSGQE